MSGFVHPVVSIGGRAYLLVQLDVYYVLHPTLEMVIYFLTFLYLSTTSVTTSVY